MVKRIISLLLSISILCGITMVFAENNENIMYSNGIVNIENITEDNVIYNALQNNRRGVSLFSGTSSDEITADFDIVFGFDMSASMYNFDYNGEMTWLDDFAAIEEQVPTGTRFASVTDQREELTNNLSSQISTLKSQNYNGDVNIIDLLDNCLNSFDDESVGRNKIIVATAAEVEDADALKCKIDELCNYDVLTFVLVLNSKKNESLNDASYICQCANDLDLQLAVSDLYLSFSEFANISLTSDFNDSREIFECSSKTNTQGLLMASILNKYKCVPMKAVCGNLNYDLLDMKSKDKYLSFLKAANKDLGTMPDSFANVWNSIFDTVSKDATYTAVSEDEIKTTLLSNLKRRFPILIKKDEEWYIASNMRNGIITCGTYSETDKINSQKIRLADIEAAVDTYEYLMATATFSNNIWDEVTLAPDTVSIKTAYPQSYALVVNSDDSKQDTVRKEALDDESGDITFSVASSSNVLITSVSKERHFLVESCVMFNDGIANIYGANKEYKIKFYNDVSSSEWYYDYLFKATSLGMVQGDDNGMFNANNPVTLSEFLKMLLMAANIECGEENEDEYWALPYITKANEIGLTDISLDDAVQVGSHQISRGETAQYIYNLFLDDSMQKYVNTATLLYKYTEDASNYKSEAFKKYKDISDGSQHKNAIYQLYLNNIMNGYDSTSMGPDNKLTRAEVCTMLIRCLFNLDENTSQILVNMVEDNIGTANIELTSAGAELKNIVFDNNKQRKYNVHINTGDTHRYYVEIISDAGVDMNITNSKETKCQGYTISDKKVYVLQGAGVYAVSLQRSDNSSDAVSLKITDMDSAQYLDFEPQPGGKYIYSNNRETIHKEDLADANNPNGSQLLFRQSGLKTGTYTLMLTHRSVINGLNIFVDMQFYDPNKNSSINIKRYGDDRFGTNHPVEGAQKSWACMQGYAGYFNSNIGRVRTQTADVEDDEESLLIKSASMNDKIKYPFHDFSSANKNTIWLSELYNNTTHQYASLTTGEGIYVMMEFEIVSEEGIDISIAAFEDNENFENRFNKYIPTENAPYIRDDALKGIAQFMPKTEAKLTFFADDTLTNETRQRVKVRNPFNTAGLETTWWKTHMNPQYESWNASLNVESDILPMYYADNDRTYIFDTRHNALENNNALLPEAKILQSVRDEAGNEIVGNGSSNYETACNMGNYGVCETYKVSVVNLGDKPRTFCYRVEKDSNMVLSVRDESGKYLRFKVGNDYVNAICTGQAKGKGNLHPIIDSDSDVKVSLPKNNDMDNITELLIEIPKKTKLTFYVDETLPTGDPGSIPTYMILK